MNLTRKVENQEEECSISSKTLTLTHLIIFSPHSALITTSALTTNLPPLTL